LAKIDQAYANDRYDYCGQSEELEDYCNPQQEEEAAAEEEDAAAEEEEPEQEGEEEEPEGEQAGEEADAEEEAGRKLFERKLANAIDCNQCAAYECYVNEEDLDDKVERNENLDEEVSQWIGNLAECQETGKMWDNVMNLYVGAMCDSYGDGVELAVFANEDCTWYTNQYAFADVYSFNANADGNANDDGNSINYLMYAEDFIKSAFSEITPCAQLQFANVNEDGEQEEEDDENNEMNDYCQGVLEENAVSFANCGADNQDEQQNQNENAANYAWYTYDMEEADDAADVCQMLKQKQAGDYSHAYDQDSSGSWYTRDRSGNIVNGKSQQKEGLSAGAIVGIVIAVLAVLLIAVGVGRSCKAASRKRAVDTDYSGGEMS